jgi:hypothetical protein
MVGNYLDPTSDLKNSFFDAIEDQRTLDAAPGSGRELFGSEKHTDLDIKYYSDVTKIAEHRGLGHWAVYTDGTSLLAWNIVLNSPVKRILKDLVKVTALVVDSCRGYIFLAS